jgi:hypothetical protein
MAVLLLLPAWWWAGDMDTPHQIGLPGGVNWQAKLLSI